MSLHESTTNKTLNSKSELITNVTTTMRPSSTNITSNEANLLDQNKEEEADEDEDGGNSKDEESLQDSNEAQEDVQKAVIIEPPDPIATDEHATNSGEEEELVAEEELNRRVFMGASKGSSENPRRLRSKLFLGGPVRGRRRNRRQRKASKTTKSTQTRQSFTTADYRGVNLNDLSTSGNPISSTIRQHFPILPRGQKISTAVQKLILNKLTPQTSYPQSTKQSFAHEGSAGHPYSSNSMLMKQASGFMDSSRLNDYTNHWASSDDLPTYSANALKQHDQKMVPIEVIGLDPVVADSILFGPNEAQSESSQKYSTAGRAHSQVNLPHSLHVTRALASPERPRASSILHIHHFHHTPKQKPTEIEHSQGQQGEPASADDHQSDVASSQNPEPNREQWNESQAQSHEGRQLFVNEKGELVYLAADGQNTSGDNRPPSVLGSEQETQTEQSLDNSNESQQKVAEQQETQHESQGNEPSAGQTDHQASGVTNQEQIETVNLVPVSHGGGLANETSAWSANHNNESPRSSANRGQLYKPSQVKLSQLPHSKAIGPHQMVYAQTDGGMATAGYSNQPSRHHEGDGRMLMVTYRPQKHPLVNVTESMMLNRHRNVYNEGQESKSLPISAKNVAALNQQSASDSSNLFLHRLRLQQQLLAQHGQHSQEHPEVQSPNLGKDFPLFAVRPQVNLLDPNSHRINGNKTALTSESQDGDGERPQVKFQGLNQVPALMQLPGNQVPSTGPTPLSGSAFKVQTIPMLANSLNLFSNNSNEPGKQQYQGSRLLPNGELASQLNGYGGGNKANISLHALHPFRHKNFIEKLALFKHLKQLQKQHSSQQQLPMSHLNFANNPMDNSTKLTNHELISFLQDFKQNIGNSSRAVYANGHSSGTNLPDNNMVELGVQRPNRFEFTQASNQLPAKFVKSHLSETVRLSGSNNTLAGFHRLQQQHRQHTVAQSNGVGGGNLFAPHDSNGKLQPQPPVAPMEETSEFNDSMGNAALAFICFVSLVTLTIIAASMVYRHKRRSLGRCADLPGRSRLNLTQRTRRFMRSNFFSSTNNADPSPGVSKSIDSPNSGGAKLVKRKSAESVAAMEAASVAIKNARDTSSSTGGSNAEVKGQTFTQPMSTFMSSLAAEKFQYAAENSATDIKTLNTRLQKPSYLKSLISLPVSTSPETPQCSSANNNGKRQQADPKNVRNLADAAYYMNLRQKSANLPFKQSNVINSNQSKLGHSFKKLSCDPSEPKNCFNRMSTIQSINDGETISRSASPNQHKHLQQVILNKACRPAKLQPNSTAPKHLVAHSNLEDRARPLNLVHIDRL